MLARRCSVFGLVHCRLEGCWLVIGSDCVKGAGIICLEWFDWHGDVRVCEAVCVEEASCDWPRNCQSLVWLVHVDWLAKALWVSGLESESENRKWHAQWLKPFILWLLPERERRSGWLIGTELTWARELTTIPCLLTWGTIMLLYSFWFIVLSLKS